MVNRLRIPGFRDVRSTHVTLGWLRSVLSGLEQDRNDEF